jgi:hypothetical protein
VPATVRNGVAFDPSVGAGWVNYEHVIPGNIAQDVSPEAAAIGESGTGPKCHGDGAGCPWTGPLRRDFRGAVPRQRGLAMWRHSGL